MKEIKEPTPKSCTTIDNVATAKRMVKFRKAYRITAVEVAKMLKTPEGKRMTRSSMNYFESGKGAWPAEFCEAYVTAVKKIAARTAVKKETAEQAAVLKVVGKPATN